MLQILWKLGYIVRNSQFIIYCMYESQSNTHDSVRLNLTVSNNFDTFCITC